MSDIRIDQRIALHHRSLSPQERKAAETLIEHLEDLATYRAAELADLAGVSRATMSRLFRSLGFTGFDEVRDHLRTLRSAGEPRRLAGTPDLSQVASAEADAISDVLGQPALARAVSLIAEAPSVLVAGWRNSYPVALHLRQQLAQARPAVRLVPVPGQTIGEEIADLGPDDAVVAVGFRRRPTVFGMLLEAVAETGASIVVIADPSASLHLTRADAALTCSVEGPLAYDSYAAAMCLVSVVADGVLHACGRGARERVSTIGAAYDRLRELE
ncbi:MAG: MurR/RpiR family transcriptional regulator [Nocardioides sp.]|nr:MurR/RpiR family transcriptional regulator [Nocardioides sp.]